MINNSPWQILDEMFSELKALGYDVHDTYYFANVKTDYKDALPVLLKYLEYIEDPNHKEGIIRGLSVKDYTEAVPVLIKEYRKSKNSSLKWVIGNALWIIGDRTIADDIIQLLNEKAEVEEPPKDWPKGAKSPEVSAKETLLWALGATRDEKAIPVLLQYLQQEDFTGHALEGLKYFKDHGLIEAIKPALKHRMAWVRKKAERLMAQLKKIS